MDEPIEDHGTIVTDGQILWGIPDDRADATIHMNPNGRAQLIRALIRGARSIEVCASSGALYSLHLRSIEGYYLDDEQS